MCRNRKKRKGFTLIEILIVVTIIGILSLIAVPLFLGQRTKAIQAEAKGNLESLRLLEEQFYAENGIYTTSRGTCAKNNDGNVALIQIDMPGFRPGSNLNFSYCTSRNVAINPANITGALIAQTPCCTARAFGNSGTPAEGSEFRIDCNNITNF
jgi:prepilin-type N-terminal cleavage/methylation domain-containing protein